MFTEWKQLTFSEAVEINPRRLIPSGTIVPYVEMAAVPTQGASIGYFLERKSGGGGAKFKNGDTLFARITPCAENGKIALVSGLHSEECGLGSTELIVFGPRDNITDPAYIYHLARSEHVRGPAISQMIGTTGRARIPNTVFDDITILLPPLNQQRRIAEILSSVDDAIAATQAVIEQTKKVKHATLERLLTKGIGHTHFKQTEIGKIPESWNVCKLSDIAKIKHGYAYSGEFFSKDERHNILITPGNFSKDKTLYFGNNTKYYDGPILKDFILKNGDILVVMTDLTPSMDILGNSVILNADKIVLHNQRIGKIEFLTNSLASEFLNNLLNSKRIQDNVKKTASGTTVRHTSPSRILENIIALPTKEEQLSISKILDNFDSVINCQQIELEHIRRLKSALMSDLLTGRKRVTDTLPLAAE